MVEISQTLSGRSAIIDLIKKQLRGHCLRNCLLNTRRNQFGRHCPTNVLYRYPYPMSAGPACTISMQGIRFVQQVAALRSGQGNVIISIVSTVPGLLTCSRKPGKPDPGICSFLRNLVKNRQNHQLARQCLTNPDTRYRGKCPIDCGTSRLFRILINKTIKQVHIPTVIPVSGILLLPTDQRDTGFVKKGNLFL